MSDLVSALAVTTGLPEATVFAYGRFAREAGHISQKGRGNAAASMTATDAANLLLAVAGTAITRDAGKAIERYRPLLGTFIEPYGKGVKIVEWLEPLGIKRRRGEHITDCKLKADLGQTVQFLISEAESGRMGEVLRSIPVLDDYPPASRGEPFKDFIGLPTEILIEKGGKVYEADHVVIGSHVNINIVVDRNRPWVRLQFERRHLYNLFSPTEVVLEVSFDSPNADEKWFDLEIEARVSVFSIAALGAALAGRPIPKKNYPKLRKALFPPVSKGAEDGPSDSQMLAARKGGAA